MVQRLLLLVLGLALGAKAACVCGANQTLGAAPFFYWSGAVDDSTKKPCPDVPGGMCTYMATGNETFGIYKINFVSFDPSCGSATVVVADGGNPVFTVNSTNAADPSIEQYVSLTNTITLTLTLQSNTACPLTVIMYPHDGFRTTPAQTTTTPVLTTTQYLNTLIPINPSTVALDLAFVFVTTSNNQTLFTQMQQAAVKAISALDVVTGSISNTDATRLTLQTFTPVSADNLYGVPWQLSSLSCITGINGLEIIPGNSAWKSGLNSLLTKFFNSSSGIDQLPRNNTQRVYAVFTLTDPLEDIAAVLNDQLSTDDVHMVIVDFRPTQSTYFSNLMSQNIKNLAYVNYDDSKPYYFMNKYITNGDSDPNFGCAPSSNVVNVTSGVQNVTFPPQYGPGFRYCNNQDVAVSIVSNGESLCFVVPQYELEVERDYLRIFDGNGKEQVSLTGFDVSGSKFTISTPNAMVRFQTNANQVYGGVTMSITSGKC